MVEKNDYLNKTQFSVNPKWTGNLKELANAVQAGGGGAGEDSAGTMSSRNAALAQNPWAAAATYGTSQLADSSKSEVEQLKDLINKEEQRDYNNFQWQRQNEEDASRAATNYQFIGDESQRNRDFTAEQNSLGREFTSNENQKGRDFYTNERLGSQEFSSGETQKNREDWYKQNKFINDLNVSDPDRMAIRNFYNMMTNRMGVSDGSGSEVRHGGKFRTNTSQMAPTVSGNIKYINQASEQRANELNNLIKDIDLRMQYSDVRLNQDSMNQLSGLKDSYLSELKNLQEQNVDLVNADIGRQTTQRAAQWSNAPKDIRSGDVSSFAGLFSPAYSSMNPSERSNILNSQNEYEKKYGVSGQSKLDQASSKVLNNPFYTAQHYVNKGLNAFAGLFGKDNYFGPSTQDVAAQDFRDLEKKQWAANQLGIGLDKSLSSEDVNQIDGYLNQIRSMADSKLGRGSHLMISDALTTNQNLQEALPQISEIAADNGIAFNPSRDPVFVNTRGDIAIIGSNGQPMGFRKNFYGEIEQF